MSTTLTNGLKLPDKGSVDWYADMQSNYTILDGAVGTIAEHTSALAGKAPLVHTHSKADITDFPVYGTTAGTICEGNDSRLSDARTPVAHTHTKSDVTDLLNSNFIPSANNSYDLGSSSYQWNNLYAKNYYYNGAAWGLDKENVWSANQTISNDNAALILKNPQMTLGVTPASSESSIISFQDVNNTSIGYIQLKNHNNSINVLSLGIKNKNETDTYNGVLRFRITKYGNAMLHPESAPCDLGSAALPFKTLNGINPGALSLPNLTSNGYINLSDNISANTEYSYTPPADGWLALYVLTTGFHVENAVGIFNGSGSGNAHRLACSATSGINLARSSYYHGAVLLPVIASIPYLCWIKIDSSTTLASKVLYFYKATGNV